MLGNDQRISLPLRVLLNGHVRIDDKEKDVLAVIPKRSWTVNKKISFSQDIFSVLSWNILSPKLCSKEKFYLSNPTHLSWKARKQSILNLLLYYEPDFICLQEVEQSDFFSFFQPSLEAVGYYATYDTKYNATDGCATFYKSDRFSLITVHTLTYNEICSMDSSVAHHGQDAYHRLLPFQNIALISMFENIHTGKVCRIVNTHLHWNPEYEDTKLLQCVILVDFLKQLDGTIKESRYSDSDQEGSSPEQRFRKKRRKEVLSSSKPFVDDKIAVIIASDLNSLPDSAVIAYLLRGYSHQRHFQGNKFGRFSRSSALQHKFRFQSVYPLGLSSPEGRVPGSDGTKKKEGHSGAIKKTKPWDHIPFTNCTPDFRGIIDYILYTPELRCIEYLGNLSPPRGGRSMAIKSEVGAPLYEGLSNIQSFPDELFPSDHLPLLGIFQECSSQSMM